MVRNLQEGFRGQTSILLVIIGPRAERIAGLGFRPPYVIVTERAREHEMADIDTTLLAVVGGFWAATNIVFSTSKISNERRDIVITGRLDGVDISPSHRRLIIWSDWVPMTITNAVICVFFGIFLVVLPNIYSLTISGWGVFVCYLFAIIPFLGAFVFAIGGLGEYQTMVNAITISRPSAQIVTHSGSE